MKEDNQLQDNIAELISISENDFRKKFFESEKIYNKLIEENFSVWKIYNDPNISEIWILDDNNKRFDARPSASKFINEIMKILGQAHLSLEIDKLNLSQFFNEAQRILKQKYGNKIQTTQKPISKEENISEIIYQSIITEFGLEHLPDEDRKEVIIELAKTIQKQFLLDVYDLIGEENFKALESSSSMGRDFYDTTLEHLVPDHKTIFKNSRKKIVKAFNKK